VKGNTLVIRQRTIYFDDARHYYLYNYDPPMTLEQARRPVEQVAGTGVDTFVYGVACASMFYPSKVGYMWGEKFEPRRNPFTGDYAAAYWKAWANLRGLIDIGLDPLTVLIEAAHENGMDFIASFRVSDSGLDPKYLVPNGGLGLADSAARDHMIALVTELATDYPTDGVELDFAAAPFGMPPMFRPQDVEASKSVLTDMVREISAVVRGGSGTPGTVGARVYPREQMCLDAGMDVGTWLAEGLLDYVVPMVYDPSVVDPDLPVDWIVGAAHENDTSVYPLMHPDANDDERRFHSREYATIEMSRAAASNYIDRGVDGLYTWFLPWPFGATERGILAERANLDRARKGDKHYHLMRRNKGCADLGYDFAIPLDIPEACRGKYYSISFYISDDLERDATSVRQTRLKLNIFNLVSADELSIRLNGQSLEGEECLRLASNRLEPYYGQWLEFHLRDVRPRKGHNVLEISLDKRPPGLEAGIRVEDVEIYIEYGDYPSTLRA